MSKIVFILSLTILFCISITTASAVSININNYPTSITNEPFGIDVFISGASAGQNYLRIDLYKDGSKNYFGDTYNELEWYSGSDGKKYFPITIDSSKTASASVQARVGSPKSSEFYGAGAYKLRIRRYTSSGNPASSDQQTPVDVQINISLPTPTSAPSPVSKSALSSKTSPTPTKSIISVPTAAITNSKKTLSRNSQNISPSVKNIVLGDATLSSGKAKEKDKDEVKTLGKSSSIFPLAFIVFGIIFAVCGILAYLFLKIKQSKNEIK